MTQRPWLLGIGIAAGLCLAGACAGEARADGIAQEALVSASGRMGSTTQEGVASLMGEPAGGSIVNGIFTIRIGYQMAPLRVPAGTRTIAVEGTIDDPTATIDVNGIRASITGTTFRAEGIQLVEGFNTIIATAKDKAENTAWDTVTVILDARPPARPTVATTVFVTTQTSYTLSGTKVPDTSIWINGTEKVARSVATTWTATVTLTEGDNDIVIVTKDAAGNVSASNAFNLILDNLPPDLTRVNAPAKTNLTPVTITGTVDDSLTRVEVNGIVARRSGKDFEVAVPLTRGPNPVTVRATSPNDHLATRNLTITLGTVPTLTSLSPPDASTVYQGAATTLQAVGTDAENDPLEFRFLINNQELRTWGASATVTWTPTQVEVHTVEAQVRDGFGGTPGSTSGEVLVLEKPLFPPAGSAGAAAPGGGGGRVMPSRVPSAVASPPPTLIPPTLVEPGSSPARLEVPGNAIPLEPAPAPGQPKTPSQAAGGQQAPTAVAPNAPITPLLPIPDPVPLPVSSSSPDGLSPRAQTPVESLIPRNPQPIGVTTPAPSLTNPRSIRLIVSSASRQDYFRPQGFFTIWYRLLLLRDFRDPFPKLAKHVDQQVEIMRQAFRRL